LIVHTYRVNYKYGDTIKIKPIFDVHYGSKNCDIKELDRYLEDSDENTYFMGGGDLLDSIVVTDPRYSKSSDGMKSAAIIDEQVEGLLERIEPYKDRIIGLGRGNHEDVIIRKCGTDPIARMCEALECKYLGLSGLIRFILSDNGNCGRTVIIRWHHGWGGGSRTQGADITKFSKDTMHWDADLFLYGHVHKKQSDRVPRLGLSGSKLISKPKLIGICGTFLRTYSDTIDSSYSELKGYPPTEIGGLTVNIKPRKAWVKMWIDI
jgi:hypothetical protein